MGRRALPVLVVGLTLLVACAAPSRLTIGEALDDIGQQFVSTAKFYDHAYASQAITADEYHEFTAWAPTFQSAYDRAYKLWQAGGDPVMLLREIDQLKRDLLIYALKLRRAPA